jgi:hypothetical protein
MFTFLLPVSHRLLMRFVRAACPSLVIIVRRLISRAHKTCPVGSGIVVVFARGRGRQRGSLPFS